MIRVVNGRQMDTCPGLIGEARGCVVTGMSEQYELMNDAYEVRKANFDAESQGANNAILITLRVIRRFMNHIGWSNWSYATLGDGNSSGSYYSDKFRVVQGTEASSARVICVVRLTMKHGDSVDVKVGTSIEDAPRILNMLFGNQSTRIETGDEGSLKKGFDTMRCAIDNQIALAAANPADAIAVHNFESPERH